MSSETLDTRIGHTHKVILKGTPEKKKEKTVTSPSKNAAEKEKEKHWQLQSVKT